MIWNSTPLMTLIDLLILVLTGGSGWIILQQRRELEAAGTLRSSAIILVGLGVIGAFYSIDLWTMHVLPRLTSPMGAMQTMESLHLNWNWIVTLTAVTCIFIGVMGIVRANLSLLRELRKSRARSSEAERVAGVGSWERNLTTGEAVWSDEVYRIFEVDPTVSGASEEALWGAVHPDDREAVTAAYSEPLDQASPFSIEYRLLMEDGRTKHVLGQTRIQLDRDGKPLRLFGTVHDVTPLETARTKLSEMNVRLERMVEERTEQLTAVNAELEAFAYSVSHDLKAPLRAIDGYSGMLEERHGSLLPEDGRSLLGVVRSNARHMARLIDDLLAFSRTARTDMVISDVDMRELAQAVFSDLSKLESDRTIEFSVGELPTVRGDRGLLHQVWTGLLENALKFTGGRETARIEIDHQDEPDHWVFRVRDNGAGFDMEYVDKLFGVFQRLHYQEEFPGTGIGLANVRRILQRHGGEVWAEGEVDAGATIFFRLPHAGPVT